MKLHLHVKSVYFSAIKDGSKKFEYRLFNDFWRKRLLGRAYSDIVIYDAYKPGEESRITMPYHGFERQTITHPHFGPDAVEVFAIHMTVSP